MQKGGEKAMTQFNNQYRYLAQITIEATTPLQIGSGEKGIKTDSLVIRDVNELPFIPGTTLAGLIAHALGKEKENLMGNLQEGSRLIVTEAKLLDKYGKVMDGLVDFSKVSKEDASFLKQYERLPIRQHVRISHKGTAKDTGKFDEEVILKGSRFCFELELISAKDESKQFDELLNIIQSPTFRIGSGGRSGFGSIKVVKCLYRALDLAKESDLNLYLEKSSSLSTVWEGWQPANEKLKVQTFCDGWTSYRLNDLSPEDFVLFGSGFGDPEGQADMAYVRETTIQWNAEGTSAEVNDIDKTILIPGSSVKGALSHRTAFYYNKLTDAVIKEDGTLLNGKTIEEVTGKNNIAVKAIFGSEGKKNLETNKMEDKQRGNILISDVIEIKEQTKAKVLNHVSIDRFTGGAIDGALFNEQTLYAKGEKFNIDIMIADEALIDENVKNAFESALKDIASGMLPLGGGVNRGNGVFNGKVIKYNKEKEQWEELA